MELVVLGVTAVLTLLAAALVLAVVLLVAVALPLGIYKAITAASDQMNRSNLRRERERWADLASAGLTGEGTEWAGERDGHPVRVRGLISDAGRPWCTVSISGAPMGIVAGEPDAAEGFPSGDPRLDRRVRFGPASALARLDAPSRKAIRLALDKREVMELADGELKLSHIGRAVPPAELIERALSLVQALEQSATLDQLARTDPLPSVRARAAEVTGNAELIAATRLDPSAHTPRAATHSWDYSSHFDAFADKFQDASTAFGLNLRAGGPQAAAGSVDGMDVELYWHRQRRSKRTEWRPAVDVRVPGLPADFSLSRAGLLTGVFGTDVRIGDADFDRPLAVAGDRAWMIAAFDDSARDTLVQWVKSGIVVDRGTVRMLGDLPNTIFLGEAKPKGEPIDMLVDCLKLARWLRKLADIDVGARLVKRATHDPEPGVRMVAIAELHKRGRTRDLEPLLTATQPGVRTAAALALDSTETLVAVLDDPHAFAQLRGRQRLGLIEAIAAAGEARAEAGLLRILDDAHDTIRRAAVGALGKVASPAAVEPLRAMAAKEGMMSSLPGVVELAVKAIQGRAVGDAGTLMLARLDEAVGALQIAEPDEAGSLMLAEPVDATAGPRPSPEADASSWPS